MKRRGFLAFLGLSGAATTVGAMSMSAPDESKGIVFRCICLNPRCKAELSQFIDLTGPVKASNQCPRCLNVLDMGEGLDGRLSEQIKQWNLAHGHKTDIYTPRSY